MIAGKLYFDLWKYSSLQCNADDAKTVVCKANIDNIDIQYIHLDILFILQIA